MSFNGPRKPIVRRKRLAAGQPLKPRGATKDKKVKRYKSFLSSAAWKALRKAALERAGNQCEDWFETRCPDRERLTVHHRTYARFGGAELPADLQVLCKSCHDRVSALEGRRVS